MVSVLMQLNEDDRQPLGFAKLNGPELYEMVGRQYGKPLD
jgi:hypothetical protein